MLPLEQLYEGGLVNSPHAHYVRDRTVPFTTGEHVVESTAEESIELTPEDGQSERVVVSRFPEYETTQIVYAGGDPGRMRETLRALSLPKSPSNLGELVFKIFRYRLNTQPTGPVVLMQSVSAGQELQFGLVLRKLAHVYNSKQINEEFYAALRNRS